MSELSLAAYLDQRIAAHKVQIEYSKAAIAELDALRQKLPAPEPVQAATETFTSVKAE